MALGKESTVDKQERGIENSLLQVIFYLRDFDLASYTRVIDIGAIESRSFDTFASFTRSLLWMERFSERKVSTTHKLHHPPCCLGNFADYGRQVSEGDRDTRSQSQNEEGFLFYPFKGLP